MFDEKKFIALGEEFQKRLAVEESIREHLHTCMSQLSEAATSLSEILAKNLGASDPLLSVRSEEKALYITGGNRNLIFLRGQGAGVDYRLEKPRGEVCGQILIFAHLTGQPETELLSNFRVYANGDCLSHTCLWNVEGGTEGFKPFLGELIRQAILEMDIYLPEINDLPSIVKNLPLTEEDLGPSPIKHPCVGFECSLGLAKKHG